MPSCWTCEQFLYLIKTQRRPRRFCRFGQRMSGCHVGQVEAIPEAGPGCPTPALTWVTQATESKTIAMVADRHLALSGRLSCTSSASL